VKKYAILIVILTVFFVVFSPVNSYSEILKGTIIGTKDNQLYVATDGYIIINAGKNFGIIIGDILPIFKKNDMPNMVDEIGRCVVAKINENNSVCHIINSRIEAGKGDFVLIKRLTYSQPQLFPLIYTAINEITVPYENHRQIRIYIDNIYDEKNNITEFSEAIKEEILSILKEKKRFSVDTTVLKEYINYQDHYFYPDIDRSKQELIYDLKKKMEQFNIDVVLTGIYKIKNDNLMVKLFLVNKNWEDKSVKYDISVKDYKNSISRIIKPYKPFKEKEFVDYKFIMNIKDYLPDADEQREIIRLESEKELNFRYKFTNTKLKFNRISPSDINVKVNDEMIRDIQKGDVYEKALSKGIKRILVSFVPTLYDNELEIISLKKEIKKEIILDLNDEKDIFIEIFLDSTYGKEFADIKVVRKKIDEKIRLRPVKTVIERQPTIELYKD